MANVRDSDTSLWLHNKLGTSNDSWTGGSICSQLNAEVLRNIKDCFPDLQTQVKLKLLLSFFHIPRRNVEEVCLLCIYILRRLWVCVEGRCFGTSFIVNWSEIEQSGYELQGNVGVVFWNKWCRQIPALNPCLPNAEVKLLAEPQQPVLRIRSIIVNLFFVVAHRARGNLGSCSSWQWTVGVNVGRNDEDSSKHGISQYRHRWCWWK